MHAISCVCNTPVLVPVKQVYDSIHLDDMATIEAYKSWGEKYGLEFVGFHEASQNIPVHYRMVRHASYEYRLESCIGPESFSTYMPSLHSIGEKGCLKGHASRYSYDFMGSGLNAVPSARLSIYGVHIRLC